MMDPLLFAAVADDDTGARELAGIFADQGVRALLVLDAAFLEKGDDPALAQAQAIVLATPTRAVGPQRAFGTTAQAVRRAAALAPRMLQIKYSSAFDSTAEGNIGPSLEAAMGILGESFAVAVPASPVNDRTTYLGYHFVHGQLLSESPMRCHPLTPMTNANLVEHLQKQTRRRVGLTPYPVVAAGPASILRHWSLLRQAGVEISIVDCLDDAQASAIAEAACELKLISGSSLFGACLPLVWRSRGWLGPPLFNLWDGLEICEGRGKLVVTASCSEATAVQNAQLLAAGAELVELNPRSVIQTGGQEFLPRAAQALSAGRSVLLKIRSTPEDLLRTERWGAAQGWSPAELGLRLAAALASITKQLLEEQLPEILVCSGGETSGAVCRALGIRAFAVDRNIQPGIPLCYPLQGKCLPIVLKSGNFGSKDFYQAAFFAGQRARSRAQQHRSASSKSA